MGYGLSREHFNSRPADVLVQSWDRGMPAAFDVTVASPLTPAALNEASGVSAGAAAHVAENRKNAANNTKCHELGYTYIPLAVETGERKHRVYFPVSRLASLLAVNESSSKPKMVAEIYGHLNLSLVRSVARAIMGRELPIDRLIRTVLNKLYIVLILCVYLACNLCY